MPKLSLNIRILEVFAVFSVFAVLFFLSDNISYDEKYIRLHIVANSDTSADQTLKGNIRDELIATIGSIFTYQDSFDSVRGIIISNLGMIEEISEKVSRNANHKYDVVAIFGEFDFPRVQYNDLILPAGKYQALKVIIGEGAGSNWWCVMYPPLCFTDSTRGTSVRNTKRTNEASARSDEQKPVEHRFRVVEWFRHSRSRLRGLLSSVERIRER